MNLCFKHFSISDHYWSCLASVHIIFITFRYFEKLPNYRGWWLTFPHKPFLWLTLFYTTYLSFLKSSRKILSPWYSHNCDNLQYFLLHRLVMMITTKQNLAVMLKLKPIGIKVWSISKPTTVILPHWEQNSKFQWLPSNTILERKSQPLKQAKQ